MERSVVSTGGLEFDVTFAGPEDGTPVVLLHGFPESAVAWHRVMPKLAAAGIRAIAPDQRGYSPGARPAHVRDYATGAIAQDVLHIADSLGISTFHLVGHDWGASIGWILAAQHPARVASYTAASIPHLAAYGRAVREDAEQQDLSRYYAKFRQAEDPETELLSDGAAGLRAFYGGSLPLEIEDEHVRRLSEPGALRAVIHWYRAMTSDLSVLPEVDVPTTYIWGDGDRFVSKAAARACGEFIDADFRAVELAGASHWIPEEHPEVLVDEILRRTSKVSF